MYNSHNELLVIRQNKMFSCLKMYRNTLIKLNVLMMHLVKKYAHIESQRDTVKISLYNRKLSGLLSVYMEVFISMSYF